MSNRVVPVTGDSDDEDMGYSEEETEDTGTDNQISGPNENSGDVELEYQVTVV
jgi:hypothetical protein